MSEKPKIVKLRGKETPVESKMLFFKSEHLMVNKIKDVCKIHKSEPIVVEFVDVKLGLGVDLFYFECCGLFTNKHDDVDTIRDDMSDE